MPLGAYFLLRYLLGYLRYLLRYLRYPLRYLEITHVDHCVILR